MNLGFLEDADGDKSSKRLAGIGSFLAMLIIAGLAVILNRQGMDALLWPFAVFGGACLGVTVLEPAKKNNP